MLIRWLRRRGIPTRQPINDGSLMAVWLVVILPVTVGAQLPQIRLHSVFPAGGQVGTTFDVQVTGGIDLEEANALVFSNPGVAAVPKTIQKNGQETPVTNTFSVTIADRVQPGVCDVRVGGLFGTSNPRSFEIGARRETLEIEPNDTLDRSTSVAINSVVNARSNTTADIDWYRLEGKRGQRIIAACRAIKLDSRMLATMEAYDAQGRRLTAGTRSGGNDPILDLTFPDDGAYYLRVFDAVFRGGEPYVYRLHIHTGPHIDFVFPPAGPAGSEETFTLFGRNLPGGLPAGLTLHGQSLEQLDVRIKLPSEDSLLQMDLSAASNQAGSDRITYALTSTVAASNRVPIHFATAPVTRETEPNDRPDQAQRIHLPAEVAGQFQSPGDIDHVQFTAKSGEVLWIETFSDRDAGAADPYLVLEQIILDKEGRATGAKRITAQDDLTADPFPGHFNLQSNDVRYKFTVPSDGSYRISLRDRYFESRGDPSLLYRLAIRPPRPDFRLIAVPYAPRNGQNNNTASPWPIGLRRGDQFTVRIVAVRRDGFNGPIAVAADGLPSGVNCHPSTIETGQVQTTLVFTSSEQADPTFATVRVFGRAHVAGVPETAANSTATREVIRSARAGTIVWDGDQQRPAMARVSRGLGLCVINELAPFQIDANVSRIEVNRNRQVLVPVKLLKRSGFDNNVTLTFVGQPPKVQITAAPINKGKSEQLQRIFVAADAPLGTYTLLMRGLGQVSYTRPSGARDPGNPSAKVAKPQNLTVVTPATPIVLHIKEHPATLAATVPGDGSIKRGAGIDVAVTVNRVNGFEGPVTLTLPPAPNVKGLSAEPIMIAADRKSGVLRITAANDAPTGGLANMVVRATMVFHGEAAVDLPLNLKVAQ